MDAFEEDHERDMQDPEYARVWGETVKAIAAEQRRAEPIEFDMEDYAKRVQYKTAPPDDSDW